MSDTLTCARVWFVVLFLMAISASPCQARFESRPAQPWRAVHLLNYNTDSDLEALGQNLGKLAEMGINTVILEVDYNFSFKSHPELRRGSNPITREGARKFAATCRKLGIRLIPEFQSLGRTVTSETKDRRRAGNACAEGCNACVARVARKGIPRIDGEQAMPAQKERSHEAIAH